MPAVASTITLAIYQLPNVRQTEFIDVDAVLRQNRHRPAGEIVQAVTEAVAEFAAGAPPADDLTLLVAKRI